MGKSLFEVWRTRAAAIVALAVVGVAVTVTVHRLRSDPSATSHLPPQPSVLRQAETSPEEPANVLVWIESAPPGATIVRVSDGFVLGLTPETIEFRRSPGTVRVRLDATGFIPAVRDVPTTSDGQVSVTLLPTPALRGANNP